MARTNITIDVSNLLNETSGTRYPKLYGTQSCMGSQGAKLNVELVTDANAKFINLFGLSVDADSGDVALGYFPNNSQYICVGNFYEMLRTLMFGTKKKDLEDSRKRIQNSDFKFILEDLKINPKYRSNHYEDIEHLFKSSGSATKYDSVILNLVYERLSSGVPKYMKSFLDSCSDGVWVRTLINQCILLSQDLESVSRDFFNNFIAESGSLEVVSNSRDTLKDSIEGRKPNLDSLMLKYISYGIPIDFLLGLKSYGFGIKQRKSVLPSTGVRSLSSLPVSTVAGIGEKLSSLTYVEVGQIEESLIHVYNIMDLIRATGTESEILFSIEMLREKNSSLYTGISKRLGLDDIFLDCKISDKDFISGITRYEDRFLNLIDRGSMYSRNITFEQYSLVSFSSKMLESSGKLFQKAVGRVIKKF